MGLFDKVMNALYEDEGSPPPKKQSAPASSSQASAKAPVKKHPVVAENTVYQKFTSQLKSAMEKENLPGFDLYEFHQIYKSAVAGGKATKMAFIEALKSSKTMRVSNQSLISNHDHYRRILNDQKDRFDSDMKNYYDSNIKNPKADKDSIESSLAQKLSQYEKLGEEIETLKAQKKAIGLDTGAAETQIEDVKTAFTRAYNEITHELSTIVDILQSLDEE
ncbi:MAG: hypothetical protein OEZ36_06560 [Spirochaetota bacterium]|nr:hypothetical protein [Spirochaetota bacterium]